MSIDSVTVAFEEPPVISTWTGLPGGALKSVVVMTVGLFSASCGPGATKERLPAAKDVEELTTTEPKISAEATRTCSQRDRFIVASPLCPTFYRL